MQRLFGMLGTFAIGMAAFAPAINAQVDQPKAATEPIEIGQLLDNAARILVRVVDTNHDGQLSQKEVGDTGLLLVGGFFFRADANGDGVLTPEEFKQVQDNLFAQQPLLKVVLERAMPSDTSQADQTQTAPSTGSPATAAKQLIVNPARVIGELLDANQNHKIEASEVRQAVKSGVQVLFSLADKNQDGQLTPHELTVALDGLARSTVQTAFQAADSNRNGEVSLDEFDKALAEPTHAFFRVIDADNNKQISLAEVEQAEKLLANLFARRSMPEPPNSQSQDPKSASSSSTTRTQVNPIPAAPSVNSAAAPR